MIPLRFPDYQFKFKSTENKHFIWDSIRKKYIVLTPEEWVRQHTIRFLIENKSYQPQMIAVEKQFTINGLKKRADVVVFNADLSPYIVVECKAPQINIEQSTFDQIARYNLSLNATYLMLTNGLNHYFCQLNHRENNYVFLKDLPNKRE